MITGAGSGIGEACALALAGHGWRVFAGVLTDTEAATVVEAGGANVLPLLMDVTDAASIEAARAKVSDAVGGAGLSALINNAGVSLSAPLELVSMVDLERVFRVNVFGVVQTCQAFIPLLRASRGRIVNIGSAFAWVALPYVGPYAAAKAALEKITDSFRYELKESGIRVSLVAAGPVATPIWSRSTLAAATAARKISPEARSLYNWPASLGDLSVFSAPENQIPAAAVVEVVLDAVSNERPGDVYAVGEVARQFRMMGRLGSAGLRHFLVRRALRAGKLPRS